MTATDPATVARQHELAQRTTHSTHSSGRRTIIFGAALFDEGGPDERLALEIASKRDDLPPFSILLSPVLVGELEKAIAWFRARRAALRAARPAPAAEPTFSRGPSGNRKAAP